MRKSLSIVITLFLFLFIIVSIANILESDIDRAQSELIREDLKRITIVAQLNPYQFLQVWRVMNESRSEPIKIGGETEALRGILFQEQINAWNTYQEFNPSINKTSLTKLFHWRKTYWNQIQNS